MHTLTTARIRTVLHASVDKLILPPFLSSFTGGVLVTQTVISIIFLNDFYCWNSLGECLFLHDQIVVRIMQSTLMMHMFFFFSPIVVLYVIFIECSFRSVHSAHGILVYLYLQFFFQVVSSSRQHVFAGHLNHQHNG